MTKLAALPTFARTRVTLGGVTKTMGNVLFYVTLTSALIAVAIYAGLQFYGVRFYAISTTSMSPYFTAGDVVGVKAIEPHRIKPGDVIAFTNPTYSQPVIHRVDRIKSDPDFHAIYKDKSGEVIGEKYTWAPRTFWTKGDNNQAEDGFATDESAVLGKQVMVVPRPFNLIATLFDKRSLFALGVGFIGLYVIWEMADGVKSFVRHRKPKATTEVHRIEGTS